MRWQYQITLAASWETCTQDKRQQLELDMNWFQIEKGVCQGCVLSPDLFNLHAEYIRWNLGLHEAQAGIKIARRNINNLRYVDDITLTAEGEEELRRILINMKEESEKAGLKFNVQKTEIMASSSITSWQMEGGKVGTVRFHFLGLWNHCRQWLQPRD